jgi:hypothetical protein
MAGDRFTSNGFTTATWLFLRALGVIYLLAFWSLAVQLPGLVGEHGILPARLTMDGARAFVAAEHIGVDRFRMLPTAFWLGTSDRFLMGMCVGGIGLSALLVAGIAPALMLALLWVDYLSFSAIGRAFLSYQWDALLLETGFLAIFVAPLAFRDRRSDGNQAPRVARWLMLWLLFRLMVASGAVKLVSGDPMWRDFTALSVHFETQPIPTPLAWYVHGLPLLATKAMTAAAIGIELVAPFLMLGSRRTRHVAFGLIVGLQIAIALTGNYAFFNLLTIALCVWLLDDATFKRGSPAAVRPDTRLRSAVALAAAIVTVPVSLLAFSSSLGLPLPGAALGAPIADAVEPLRSVNAYGLFAVMTPTRPEIVVEGSNDGKTWAAYEFKYKPGDHARRPPWVAPHQPRLDWQMWFAALGSPDQAPWFENFCRRLLEGSPAVLALLEHNPFPDGPPRYVRSTLYRYRFADAHTRRTTGAWWTREPLGEFLPPLSLDAIGRRMPPAR